MSVKYLGVIALALLLSVANSSEAQKAKELPKTRTLNLPGGVKLELVLVPKGRFWMSEKGKNAQKQVEIEHDFYLGKFEVTQEQWQAVMGNNPSYFSREGTYRGLAEEKEGFQNISKKGKDSLIDLKNDELAKFPVEQVSWEDCQKFLKKLNEKNEERGWLYRLPKKSEREYGCRGGPTSKESCSYRFYFKTPTNDLGSKQANLNGNKPYGKAEKGPSLGRPTKVGSYAPNALGLYDMHGNVAEWCDDWYTDNGVKEGAGRLCMGGGWYSSAQSCRAAHYIGLGPMLKNSILGFRVALVPAGR